MESRKEDLLALTFHLTQLNFSKMSLFFNLARLFHSMVTNGCHFFPYLAISSLNLFLHVTQNNYITIQRQLTLSTRLVSRLLVRDIMRCYKG